MFLEQDFDPFEFFGRSDIALHKTLSYWAFVRSVGFDTLIDYSLISADDGTWEHGTGTIEASGVFRRTNVVGSSAAANGKTQQPAMRKRLLLAKRRGTMKSVLVTADGDFTVPPGVGIVYATLVGGGGAGGGADAAATAGSGGGSAGWTMIRVPIVITGSTTITVDIGAAGVGATDASGGNGGNTTITYYGTGGQYMVTAPGGLGGAQSTGATGGKGGDSATINGVVSDGGAGATGGTAGTAGEDGQFVAPWALAGAAGGGGALNGAGGVGGDAGVGGWNGGITYSGDQGSGGGGGASFFGGGGDGAMGDGASGGTAVQEAYGSGGGGSGGGGVGGTSGMNGVAGAVLFEYWEG